MNETDSSDHPVAPSRRLIIIVVETGEDPVIEHDPDGSFAYWEVRAVLARSLEIIEDEELADKISAISDEEDDDE